MHELSSLDLSKHALNLSFSLRENNVCLFSKISESGMEDGCREKFACEILASQLGTGGAKPGTDYDQLGGEGDPLKNEANQLTSVSQLSPFRGQHSTTHAALPRNSQVCMQRELKSKGGPRSINPPPPFGSKRYSILLKAHQMSLKWESFSEESFASNGF